METEDFANLLFKIEEMLVETDYWRRQISDCKQCKGWSEEDCRNMCPSCLKALAKEFEALRDAAGNEELRALIRNLKKALKDDKTGEYQRILNQSRERSLVHYRETEETEKTRPIQRQEKGYPYQTT
jgi:plasmid maintenance system killer protein